MYTFKISYFIITALFILSFLTSCQKEHPDVTELKFWAMGAEGEKIKLLLPEFKERNPDIKITIQSIPWGAAHEKLLTAFAGNTMPDVCQLGNTWIPEFETIGALDQLDPYIQNSLIIKQNNFFDGVWQTNIINNRLFGIPWYVDTRVLFYRTDVLHTQGYDSAPQTWDQLLEVSRKIVASNKNSDTGYAFYYSLIANDGYVPVMFIMANGGKFLKDNFQYAAFDDEKTKEALRYYLTFFQDRLASRSMTEFTNIYQGFAQRDFAMMVHGPWVVNEIRNRFSELNGKWATAIMPLKENRTSLAGGASLVIFKNAKNPQAAWKWIEFLCEKETQIKFFNLTRDLPSVKTAWEDPLLKDDAITRVFYQQLENVTPTPQIPEWEQIYVKLQEHLELVIHEKVEFDDMIKQLNNEVNQILEKRRWLLANDLLNSQ